MAGLPEGWVIKPNTPQGLPEGWSIPEDSADFSDAQGGASSEAIPNTVQQPSSGLAGGFAGAVSKFPYGPQIAAKIASMAGNRDVSLQEMQQYLANQRAATPTSYGRGEVAGQAAPSLMAAAATGGMSIPAQVAAQGAVGAGQKLTAGGDIKDAALEGGKQAAFTLGGMGLAKGVGAGASALGEYAQPILRKIANAAILKQTGYIGSGLSKGAGIKGLYNKAGEEGVAQTAEDVAPYIGRTVQKTASNLENVVEPAEAQRAASLAALDKKLSVNAAQQPVAASGGVTVEQLMRGNPGLSEDGAQKMLSRLGTSQSVGGAVRTAQAPVGSQLPTVGDVVTRAKNVLAKLKNEDPSMSEQAKTVSKVLDDYVTEWGEGTQSFSKLDKLRQQLQAKGNFKTPDPSYPAQMYRALSRAVREDVDNAAMKLDPENAVPFKAAKATLTKYIGPSETAAERAFELSGQSQLGLIGSGGLTAAAELARHGQIGPAAAAVAASFLQKPARQYANYALAKGTNAAANTLEGGAGSSVGGLMSSTPASLSSGTAAGLMSQRMYNQPGQLAEKLGSPQAPLVKRASEDGEDNGQTVHNYLMNSNGQYAQTMKSAGTSTDRRQP